MMNLDSFNHLRHQYPFEVTHGQVGRLNIKVPWKAFGRAPIEIVLENLSIEVQGRHEVELNAFHQAKHEIIVQHLQTLLNKQKDTWSDFISSLKGGWVTRILATLQIRITNIFVVYHHTHPQPQPDLEFQCDQISLISTHDNVVQVVKKQIQVLNVSIRLGQQTLLQPFTMTTTIELHPCGVTTNEPIYHMKLVGTFVSCQITEASLARLVQLYDDWSRYFCRAR